MHFIQLPFHSCQTIFHPQYSVQNWLPPLVSMRICFITQVLRDLITLIPIYTSVATCIELNVTFAQNWSYTGMSNCAKLLSHLARSSLNQWSLGFPKRSIFPARRHDQLIFGGLFSLPRCRSKACTGTFSGPPRRWRWRIAERRSLFSPSRCSLFSRSSRVSGCSYVAPGWRKRFSLYSFFFGCAIARFSDCYTRMSQSNL